MDYIDVTGNTSVDMQNFGTETSATSSFMPSNIKRNLGSLIGGGWLFDDSASQKALKAFREREMAAGSFLVRNDMINDYNTREADTGRTILHYVARFHKDIPNVQDVLTKIMTNGSVSSFVNTQDNDGN